MIGLSQAIIGEGLIPIWLIGQVKAWPIIFGWWAYTLKDSAWGTTNG